MLLTDGYAALYPSCKDLHLVAGWVKERSDAPIRWVKQYTRLLTQRVYDSSAPPQPEPCPAVQA